MSTTMPRASRSCSTFELSVRTAWGWPSTTRVTFFSRARYKEPTARITKTNATFPVALRIRNRRTRVGRTSILPPNSKKASGGAPAISRAEASMSTGGTVSTLNPHCKLESKRVFEAPRVPEPLSKPVENRARVRRRRVTNRFEGRSANIGDVSDHLDDIRRRVVAAPNGLRGEEWAVGLDQKLIERGGGGRLPKVPVLRIREVAGERQEPPAGRALLGDRRIAAEAVEDDSFGRSIVQEPEGGRPCIPNVNNNGKPCLNAQRDVENEGSLLIVSRRSHPIEVEPAFPDCDDPGHGHHLPDLLPSLVVQLRGGVGMHPGRGEHLGKGLGELDRTVARLGVDAGADQTPNACPPRSRNHLGGVLLDQEQMAMGVNGGVLRGWLGIRGSHGWPTIPALDLRSTGDVAGDEPRLPSVHPESRDGVSRETRGGEPSPRSRGAGTAVRPWLSSCRERGGPTPRLAGSVGPRAARKSPIVSTACRPRLA